MSDAEMAELLKPRHMSESYTSFDLPLKSDPELLERYVNAMGGFREFKSFGIRARAMERLKLIYRRYGQAART